MSINRTPTTSLYEALGDLLVVSVRVHNAARKGDAIPDDLMKSLQIAIDVGRNSIVEHTEKGCIQ